LRGAANQAVGSRLPARVSGLADVGAVRVVGNTARADADDKLVSAHVGEARDIDGGKVARRELAPGVEDLAVGRHAGDVAVEGAEGPADAVVHGHGDALAEGDGDGQLGGMGSHKGRGEAVALVPEHQDDVGVGVRRPVGECEDVGPVVADPNVAVAGRVGSHAGKPDPGKVLAVTLVQVADRAVAAESKGRDGIQATGNIGKDLGSKRVATDSVQSVNYCARLSPCRH